MYVNATEYLLVKDNVNNKEYLYRNKEATVFWDFAIQTDWK